MEKSPEDLQKIITEVLNLPSQQRKELADLLDSTSLVSLVSIAKEVTNRLHFINGLEELLFNDKFKNDFKERLQLQKLLEENTWFFGEEYHLVANDQSLTNVLKKYAKEQEFDVLVDEPVQSYRNKKNDIIDLMISKANKRVNPREISNLVIELKSPKQPILTNREFFQIQAYATAVAKDERFHNVKARWDFIVISNEMDEMVQDLASQKNRSGGLCFDKDNIKIWVKTWSEIIADNKERHKFLNDAVSDDLTKTRSLEYLRSTHEELLKDLIPAQQIEEEETGKE